MPARDGAVVVVWPDGAVVWWWSGGAVERWCVGALPLYAVFLHTYADSAPLAPILPKCYAGRVGALARQTGGIPPVAPLLAADSQAATVSKP